MSGGVHVLGVERMQNYFLVLFERVQALHNEIPPIGRIRANIAIHVILKAGTAQKVFIYVVFVKRAPARPDFFDNFTHGDTVDILAFQKLQHTPFEIFSHIHKYTPYRLLIT